MRHLFVLLYTSTLLPAVFAGVDFLTCLANVRSGLFGTVGGRDNHGNPVDISNATAITYELCLTACGAGPEAVQWSVFTKQFSSWFLPWLALVSHIPFGSHDKLDNLESVLLTIGSPALAAYSLALTVLNGRWISHRFREFTYPNIQRAIRIFNSLQQAPLRVVKDDALLASLVVLPNNDEWWLELDNWLNDTHSWSIAAVASIGWVVIAFIFTVADSLGTNPGPFIEANGQAVGSLWLWLLPIIVGCLMISPKCDSVKLSNVVGHANRIAYVATNDDSHKIILARESETEKRAVELTLLEVDSLTRDEKCTAPVYNYARFLPWVMAVEIVCEAFHGASDHFHDHLSVNPAIDWVAVDRNQPPHESNRVGNRDQLQAYCKPLRGQTARSHWGPNVFSRMMIASFFAIMLQWGTTGSAVIVAWYTPTVGLGCRSLSYIVYGGLSTFVWILLVSSSILTHYATAKPLDLYHRNPVNDWSMRAARSGSIFLRRCGKAIATINSIWIFISCMFQLSNFYDRCYCNSSVFGLHGRAYDVIQLVGNDLADMKHAWIGGVCLALGVVAIYVGFIGLLRSPPKLPD